jgi:hypothetical protein
MKKQFFLLALSMAALFAHSQSKVFKEVSEEIRSQVLPIHQDQSLVGYLSLSQLEKASEDSFNYRLIIMDENLNDIGKVEFREENLEMHAVSFDQDVLCLGYFRTMKGKSFKKYKDFEAAKPTAASAVFFQFLTLEGKVIKTASIKTAVELKSWYRNGSAVVSTMGLEKGIRLTNVTQKGFVCYFEDDNQGRLAAFDGEGTQLWIKKLAGKNIGDNLLASGEDVYVLSQKKTGMDEGGWEVKGYSFNKGDEYDKWELKDKQGHELKVTGWGNHPVSGKPYLSGMILNPKRDGVYMMKHIAKVPYFGVFTVDVNGHSRKEYKETYSYWNDNSKPGISAKGRFEEGKVYPYFDHSFKDMNGNTVFAGALVERKPRWGLIATGIVLSPLVIVTPYMWALAGLTKCKISDNALMLQTPKGELLIQPAIPGNSDRSTHKRASVVTTTMHRVVNVNTSSEYLVVDDVKDIIVYNMNQKKIVRTIPHKDGNVQTGVMPAKDGHIMIMEYNKKEKYTRVSIEQI